MTRILLVTHSPSPNTRALRDAAIASVAAHADVELVTRDSLDATPDDVLSADGVAMGTTENFGAMAGRTKDFFERIYYPCLERTQGLPFVLYVRAGLDGAGTLQGIERITNGLSWRYVQPPLLLHGDWQDEFPAAAATLVETLAAGRAAGIY